MMENVVLRDNFFVSIFNLLNFSFSRKYTQKTKIIGRSLIKKITNASVRGYTQHFESEVPCFLVRTCRGDVAIEVSVLVYSRYQLGAEVLIRYQIGRFDSDIFAWIIKG
ncbi:MAG: hypothetical protein KBC62_01815 [Candidatus Pacebacteria bacterium]|nr:hypothetical protein [Candidatus Paceibacterota bacterium]MBP9842718.1 hypothetical protein [Candidatus Paceibacterota bacterium]